MPGPKTNERPGTRAVLRHSRIAPNKVREVLDLVRGKPVNEAEAILRFAERDAALVVGKLLHSAVANAENNDDQEAEELYVSACFADEGTTIKRWRPRARGRATRIRKRTSHITIIVSRMPSEQLERMRARRRAEQLAARERRVRSSRSAGDTRSRAQRRAGVPMEEPETEETTTEATASDAPSFAPGAEEPSAAEVAAAADEEGIVDTEALAVAEAEAGEVIETAADREAQAAADEPQAADEPATTETAAEDGGEEQ